MLVKTGHGSISFVAGCCWVNSVVDPSSNQDSFSNRQPLSADQSSDRRFDPRRRDQ
jgi:hypothetical protein